MPGDEAEVQGAGIGGGAVAGVGGEGDGGVRIHAGVMGIVVTEGEAGAIFIGAGAGGEEGGHAAIDLAGAVVAGAAGDDEAEAADGIGDHKFFGAAGDADAAAEQGAQAERGGATAKPSADAAGAAGGGLDFDDVGGRGRRQQQHCDQDEEERNNELELSHGITPWSGPRGRMQIRYAENADNHQKFRCKQNHVANAGSIRC